MESESTIESSITIPIAISNATSVIMLRLSPVSAIQTKAPRKATGSPIAAQIAKPGRKNRLITAITSTSPRMPFCTSIASRSRMIEVTSCTTST